MWVLYKFSLQWCTLTLKPPSRSNVGSRPTEKMRRSIVEAISARMPWGWGNTMTIARETSMAIHSRADRWGSRVPEDEGSCIRERLSIQSLKPVANYFKWNVSVLFSFYPDNNRLIQLLMSKTCHSSATVQQNVCFFFVRSSLLLPQLQKHNF